jgi:hypothetical protein
MRHPATLAKPLILGLRTVNTASLSAGAPYEQADKTVPLEESQERQNSNRFGPS